MSIKHMAVDIEGMLRNHRRKGSLNGAITDTNTGRALSDAEARKYLKDMLADELCFGEMTGYQTEAIENVITLIDGVGYDRLRELVEADRDGRVCVLPCKVGDTVYAYDDVFNQIAPFQVDMVQLYGHDSMSFCANWRKDGELMADLDFDKDDFGKTVFLTLAEAETALQEGAGQ